jgi:hypothetical protein
MKLRNGFVSNSSSSSFIIGVAKIKNKQKLINELIKHNIDYTRSYDISIISNFDILTDSDKWKLYEYSAEQKRLIVEAPINDPIDVFIKIDPNDVADYFIVRIGKDEGDGAFSDDDEDYELNYDKVYENDWFQGTDAVILDILNNSELLVTPEYTIGAGRNG